MLVFKEVRKGPEVIKLIMKSARKFLIGLTVNTGSLFGSKG